MFHIHKWSKWRRVEVIQYGMHTGRPYSITRQQRECSRCGLAKTKSW